MSSDCGGYGATRLFERLKHSFGTSILTRTECVVDKKIAQPIDCAKVSTKGGGWRKNAANDCVHSRRVHYELMRCTNQVFFGALHDVLPRCYRDDALWKVTIRKLVGAGCRGMGEQGTAWVAATYSAKELSHPRVECATLQRTDLRQS